MSLDNYHYLWQFCLISFRQIPFRLIPDETKKNEAVLLVDASNAFNSLNRQVVLHSIQRLCLLLAAILINTYRAPTELFVDGDTILSHARGHHAHAQGDPLAMPLRQSL